MLKKASLTTKPIQEIPIKFKVTKHTYSSSNAYETGWSVYRNQNDITAIPYWTNLTIDGSQAVLKKIDHTKGNIPNYVDETSISLDVDGDVYDTSKSLHVTIRGSALTMWPRRDGFVEDTISGDPWNLDGSIGETLLVTFDPPQRIPRSKHRVTSVILQKRPWRNL